MIGTQGTLRHVQTYIRNVPILFCPVCRRVIVNPLVESEYEWMADYAFADGALEIDFTDHVTKEKEELFSNCVNTEFDQPLEMMQAQIDNALDLLAFAAQIGDQKWMEQLQQRLTLLSKRQANYRSKHQAN